jgi:hypothetical protein
MYMKLKSVRRQIKTKIENRIWNQISGSENEILMTLPTKCMPSYVLNVKHDILMAFRTQYDSIYL